MRHSPQRGLPRSLNMLLPLLALVAACGEGAHSDPTTADTSGLSGVPEAVSQNPAQAVKVAFARYRLDPTAANLAAVRQAKMALVASRWPAEERAMKSQAKVVRSNALVSQAGTGGTTEWTYAWAGAQVLTDASTTLIPLTVPGHGTIQDVDAEITELRHNWDPDLIIHLLSPGGATSLLTYGNPQAWDVSGLTANPNPTVDFIGTYFNDQASKNISAWDNGALGPFTGSFQPYGPYNFSTGLHSPPTAPLSLANGQDINGTWQLQVQDIAKPDQGTLYHWRLIFTIQGPPLPDGAVGKPYSATPNGIGTDGSYTWSVASGSLPAGLSLNATTGLVSGTPTATGTSSFSIQGVPANGGPTTASSPVSITVNAQLRAVDPGPLPDGTAGSAYANVQLSATGGGGGYTWTSSNLPPGMTLSADGVLGGTPTTAGSYSFTAAVSSGDGQSASLNLSVSVVDPALSVTTTSPIVTVAGVSFSQALQATGGGGGYVWSIASGTLPAGLSLSGGVISGTPTTVGEVQTVTVSVRSANGSTASKALTFQVADPSVALAVTSSGSLPGGTRGQPYSTLLAATGSDHNYTWSLVSGTLPDGLTLAADGTISGTPTLAGTHTFTVQVQSGTGASATASLSLEVVNPPVAVTTTSLPAPVWGVAYSAALQATGGTGTYSWSVASGALPPGLSLSGGVLSGTPTQPGSFTFTVGVSSGTDPYVVTDQKTFTVAVTYPQLVITTASLPSGGTDAPYADLSLTAKGGNNQYTWSIASGSLPPGLTLTNGVISGTPTQAGFYPLAVEVQSGITGFIETATKSLSISVVLQVPDSAGCANGGYAQFRFETEAQCLRFVATGMDSRQGQFPTLVLTDTSVSAGQTEVPYSYTFTATGGADNLDSYKAWTATGLPGWLSLDSLSGTLSGTPLIAGNYPFTVTVTSYYDMQTASLTTTLPVSWSKHVSSKVCANGVWAQYDFNSETQCTRFVKSGMDSREGQFPDPVVTTTSLPNGRPGEAYSATLTSTGGADNPDSHVTWAVTGMPSWMSLDAATGTLSGTPVDDGSYTLGVTVTSTDPTTGYDVASAPVSLTLRVSTDPTTVDECKKGGWRQFGFRNQGQCIAFVKTGHDSRDGGHDNGDKGQGSGG